MLCKGLKPFLALVLVLPAFAGSSVPGIENFYKLDDHVYRGAQPSGTGFRYLAQVGVRTVIDLRAADARSRAEEQVVTATGLKYINIPMTGLTAPTQAQTDKILAILEDPAAEPVFVHCKRGADRTGAVIASYRIEHDGWDSARALQEAMDHGMSALQFPRQSFIRNFQGRNAEAVTSIEAVPQDAPHSLTHL
jgi:tyrosine-protein phosphatase SIW14